MNVGELEDLLARLPDDMPVYIAGGDGCRHVSSVDKMNRHFPDPEFHQAWNGVPLTPGQRLPAAVILRSTGAPLWMRAWADDVPFVLHGRWPKVRSKPPVGEQATP